MRLAEAAALIIDDVATAPGGTDVGGVVSGRNAAADAIANPDSPGGAFGLGTTWSW